jgi:undecaprenyl pyrophosphate phosphatase UppP
MNNALIILGAILIVIGIFAYTYTTTTTQNIAGVPENQTQNPYRYWSYYIIIIGVILLIIGLALPSRMEEYPLP